VNGLEHARETALHVIYLSLATLYLAQATAAGYGTCRQGLGGGHDSILTTCPTAEYDAGLRC
jgi:hypothetical protein